MSNMIDPACEKCQFHNPKTPITFCDFNGTTVRCTVLKNFEKQYKFKENIKC